jgi:hypothetical protein
MLLGMPADTQAAPHIWSQRQEYLLFAGQRAIMCAGSACDVDHAKAAADAAAQ